jgi:putative NADPH-quinone reductase
VLVQVLYLYCHPLVDSFHAAIRTAAMNALKTGGHMTDVLDLYAESFQPTPPPMPTPEPNRAPVQVIDGNYERMSGVCLWWDALKARQ